MKRILLIISLLIGFQEIKCQVFGNLIEKTIQSTVLIKTGISSGSGILVRDSTSSIYLITAKHVLFDAQKQFKELLSKDGVIQFYAHDFESDSANYILLNLVSLLNEGKLKFDSIHDICCVEIAKIEKSGGIIYNSGVTRYGYRTKYDQYYIDEKAIIQKKNLFLGEDIFIVGFPSSIGLKEIPQFDYEKPLLKRGAIASTSEKYDNFIIDCPVFHGNSGGPVFLERKGFNDYKIRLIGIASQYIPLYNKTVSQKDATLQNSSYAVIVPIEYALNLINNNK